MFAPHDFIALSLLPLWRWRSVADLLRSGRAPREVLEIHCADGRARSKVPSWADADRVRARASDAFDAALKAGVRPVGFDSPDYPPLLQQVPDPPPVLWTVGRVEVLKAPSVALVGSRAGSSYAVSVAARLASDLAVRGIAVVSGLARGVDAAAHEGALTVNGLTIGALGCGADVVYPPEHAALVSRIVGRGAVVSELPPGTQPRPAFFPRRNRIISGLARAVVVIEAGERSGSLITARCALEQGRDVLAVPGSILSTRNRGGHALLRDGARLVESAEDILDEIQFRGVEPVGGAGAPIPESLPPDPILAAIGTGDGADLEEISARTGRSAGELLARLLEFELQGAVRRDPGGRFVRFDRTC